MHWLGLENGKLSHVIGKRLWRQRVAGREAGRWEETEPEGLECEAKECALYPEGHGARGQRTELLQEGKGMRVLAGRGGWRGVPVRGGGLG